MIEQKVLGALTLPVLNAFLKSVGAALAYVQVAPDDVDALKSADLATPSNAGPKGEGLLIYGKPLFADAAVPVNELRALDFDKKVIGILTLNVTVDVEGTDTAAEGSEHKEGN